jgi:hypothetical protein
MHRKRAIYPQERYEARESAWEKDYQLDRSGTMDKHELYSIVSEIGSR